VRGAVAVFGREVSERRLLAVLALGLGLVPLAAVWLPGLTAETPEEVRNGLAFVVTLGLSTVLALLLGGSIVSRDLGEGRLGFYFARPLRGWEIWAGKLAAALALTLGSALLVLLPTTLLNGGPPDVESLIGHVTPLAEWTFLGLSILALILLSHVIGVMLRARSVWLVLDFTGAAAFSLLGREAVHRLGVAGAFAPRWQVAWTLTGVTLAGFLVAGAVQVIAGRTDPVRAHRALSITLWTVLLAGALAAQGFSRWVLAGTPEGLAPIQTVDVSGGSWIAVLGSDPRRQFTSAFLVDLKSGRFVRVLPLWNQSQGWVDVKFTPDGRWAAWLEPMEGAETEEGPFQLSRLDLGRPNATPLQSNITYSAPPYSWALSPDGSRLAAIQDGRLVVDDIATGNSLAAAPFPKLEGLSPLHFVSPGLIQLRRAEVRREPERQVVWQIWALDVAQGRLRRTGGFESRPTGARWSPDGSRVVKLDPEEKAVEVLDGWTGRTLAALPWGNIAPRAAQFLADGRIVVEVPGAEGAELRVFSPDLTRELRRCRAPGAARVWIAGQPAPDLLTVAVPSPDGLKREDRFLLLDLATGSARELRSGLTPVPSSNLGPASAGSRLFLSRKGRLFALDPRTAEPRPALRAEETR
jgi:hypothetical protein